MDIYRHATAWDRRDRQERDTDRRDTYSMHQVCDCVRPIASQGDTLT